ncbi:MAG TPA: helix-turn-helix domain-containing protein [Gammaproteobacteria bacterium]|nr:helix-turn-helix domain-containing protein [Gammaproteobacteria bacterium]
MSNEATNDTKQHSSQDKLGQNLRYLMQKNMIDTATLSKKIGSAISTINQIKRGSGNPTLETISALANYFNIGIGDLTELELSTNNQTRNVTFNIPLLNLWELANFLKHPTRYLNTISIELDTLSADQYFAIRISNNSLHPIFEKGAVFILKNDLSPVDGDIVLLNFDDQIYNFRRIFTEANHFYFRKITVDQSLSLEKLDNYSISGVVIQVKQEFRTI